MYDLCILLVYTCSSNHGMGRGWRLGCGRVLQRGLWRATEVTDTCRHVEKYRKRLLSHIMCTSHCVIHSKLVCQTALHPAAHHFNVVEARQHQRLEQLAANASSTNCQHTALLDLWPCMPAHKTCLLLLVRSKTLASEAASLGLLATAVQLSAFARLFENAHDFIVS